MILDVILIGIFIGMVIYGYKKGAIGIIAKLVSVILSFVIAYFCAEIVGEYISSTNLGVNIQTGITESLSNILTTESDSKLIFMLHQILGNTVENQIVSKIVKYMFTAIGFGIIFVVARIILFIAQKVVESLFELPVLKTFNKLGGVIASILLLALELSIFLAVIKCLSVLPFMNKIVNLINSSEITRVIYNHNIVANLILTKFIK